jgi:hypothetical protein
MLNGKQSVRVLVNRPSKVKEEETKIFVKQLKKKIIYFSIEKDFHFSKRAWH